MQQAVSPHLLEAAGQHVVEKAAVVADERYVTFGVSEKGRLLVVAHTDKEEIIRVISARMASKGERKLYEEG